MNAVFFSPGYPGEIPVGNHSNGHDLHQNRLEGPFSEVASGCSADISYVSYLVIQNRNLEYGERRCGFSTRHQSTKAPRSKEARNINLFV